MKNHLRCVYCGVGSGAWWGRTIIDLLDHHEAVHGGIIYAGVTRPRCPDCRSALTFRVRPQRWDCDACGAVWAHAEALAS